MKTQLQCSKCQIKIINPVEKLSDDFRIEDTKGKDLIPRGFYTHWDKLDTYNSIAQDELIINIQDLINF